MAGRSTVLPCRDRRPSSVVGRLDRQTGLQMMQAVPDAHQFFHVRDGLHVNFKCLAQFRLVEIVVVLAGAWA